MALLAIAIVCFLPSTCSSQPINGTDSQVTVRFVGYVQDPNGRGTVGLVISCMATLGLCVWSAMHLNIPPKRETLVRRWTRSAKWMLLGILIPELVVLAAWRQWLSARQMTVRITDILEKADAKPDQPRRHPWSIEHSYYASMGGFVFDSECLPTGSEALFATPRQITLTASGVLLLAECGHLPDIDRKTICDKSKADSLSKLIVCIQAAWFIGQTLGRLLANLPITLLEVNTLAHVFCTFVLYILWWRKPKEVHSAFVLEGPWTKALAAYMYTTSRMSGKKVGGLIVMRPRIGSELSEYGWFTGRDQERDDAYAHGHLDESSGDEAEVEALTAGHHSSPWTGELRKSQLQCVSRMTTPSGETTMFPEEENHDRLRQNRRLACLEAFNIFPAVRELLQPVSGHDGLQPKVLHLVTGTPTNWPSDYYLPGISSKLMGMALWLSSSLYGGIHIAAWFDFFPTKIEQLLWRFSAVFIASSGALWFLFCLAAFRWNFADDYWHRFTGLNARKFEYAVIGAIATICGLTYILARVYLVVEAVVSLRRLPAAAYHTPGWSTVFPHL